MRVDQSRFPCDQHSTRSLNNDFSTGRALKQHLNQILSKDLENYSYYLDNIFWLTAEKAVQFGWPSLSVRMLRDSLDLISMVFSDTLRVVSMAGAGGLGLDDIVVRQLVIDPAKRDDYLSAAAFCFSVGFLFVGAAAIYWKAFPSSDSGPLLIFIMTLALPFSAISVLALDLQAIVASKQTAFARTFQSVIGSLFRLMSALLNIPLMVFAWISALEGPLFGVLLSIFHRKAASPVTIKIPRLSTFTYLAHQGWPLLLSGISIVLYMKMDQIMLKFMRGDHETGIYLAAIRLSNYGTLLLW